MQPQPATTVSVVIRRSMNDHGTMTVETEATNETRHLVDYASERVRTVLSGLPTGATIPVEMTRVGSRSNVWRASGLPSVRSDTADSPSRSRRTRVR